MASTTFVNGSTLTDEDWFNDVDRLVYDIFGDPANDAAAATGIGLGTGDSPTFAGITISGAQVHDTATSMGGTTYSVLTTDMYLLNGESGTVTVTLPAAASFTGRMLYFGNLTAQAVVSASSNVIPLGDVAAGTAILPATDAKWVIMQSDGSSWRILMGNV